MPFIVHNIKGYASTIIRPFQSHNCSNNLGNCQRFALIRYVFEYIMTGKPAIRFTFRIYVGDKRYMGPGRIELMEGILKHGSIARAAQDMGMSYRKAWQLVKDMNAVAGKALVERHLGGKSGGGAAVTKEGKEAMKQYYTIQKQAMSLFEKAGARLKI